MKLKITQKIKDAWLKDLRSNKFKQGTGQLYNKARDSYCCLGVFCKTVAKQKKKNFNNIVKEIGSSNITCLKSNIIDWKIQEKLITANDYNGKNFFEIADIIEKELKVDI